MKECDNMWSRALNSVKRERERENIALIIFLLVHSKTRHIKNEITVEASNLAREPGVGHQRPAK